MIDDKEVRQIEEKQIPVNLFFPLSFLFSPFSEIE